MRSLILCIILVFIATCGFGQTPAELEAFYGDRYKKANDFGKRKLANDYNKAMGGGKARPLYRPTPQSIEGKPIADDGLNQLNGSRHHNTWEWQKANKDREVGNHPTGDGHYDLSPEDEVPRHDIWGGEVGAGEDEIWIEGAEHDPDEVTPLIGKNRQQENDEEVSPPGFFAPVIKFFESLSRPKASPVLVKPSVVPVIIKPRAKKKNGTCAYSLQMCMLLFETCNYTHDN